MIEVPLEQVHMSHDYYRDAIIPWCRWVGYIFREHGMLERGVLPEIEWGDDYYHRTRIFRFYFKYVRDWE